MSTKKKTLLINGVERMFICDPEVDTLADVIRRLGLTGTKIGCGTGQCGACTVLVNNEVVRSCIRKIKAVEDYSHVATIEGLGTAENLHPLQLAWIVCGAVQCGFCTPGFIVSSKGLLEVNNNPTRDEVRDWFKKNRNVCRCTGYKQIVDAVMAAAKVVRGEMTMAELAWKLPDNERIFNTYVPRPSALPKVLGTSDYGDDIAMKMPEDTLFLAVVMPGVSHSNIKGIDCSEAEKAPGVFKVLTSKDVKGTNRIEWPLGHPRAHGDGFERPFLMDKKVFRYGDVVALVAADTRKHAREAAKLVKIDNEPLPEYLDILDSMADDAIEVHPGTPNIFLEVPLFKGQDTREVIPKSKYVVEGSFYSTREPHLPIEPDVAQAYVDEDGVLTIHCVTHGVHLIQMMIGAGIGWPMEKIRIVLNPVGGSFGYSISPGMAGMVGIAAIATGRPVSLTFSYEEHQHFTGKRAASYANARLACDENGRITAAELEMAYDKGAYSELADGLVEAGLRFFGAPYYIPNMMGLSKGVFSNHAFSTAYRGYGAPQVTTSSEALFDMLAEKAGIDPFEFRYINAFREGDTANAGHTFKAYPMVKIMDKLRPKYQALVERAKKLSTDKKKRGVGVASGTYIVGATHDYAEVALELNADGTVTSFNTFEDIGQGGDISALVHAHEALRPLGLKPEQVRLVQNDTGLCPPTGLAAGSRAHYFGGKATIDAAEKLMNAMRKPDGSFRTYDEMTKEGIPTKYTGSFTNAADTTPLNPNTGQGNPTTDYTFGSFACEVEVDMDTGKVQVMAMHCVSDVGVVGNYLGLDGQAYGGLSHCIGFALSEDYSDLQKHKTMAGAGIPTIDMIPDAENFTSEYVEDPRPGAPQGSGGASEVYQSSAHMAVLNAIYNATGVRIHELPATPAKVKQALEDKAKGITPTRGKYYMGGEFYDKLDEIKANPIPV